MMARTWGSTAPAAMASLAAILRGWPDLAKVKVKEMGDLTDADAEQVVTVGYLNPEEDTHADASYASGAMSAQDQRESFTIHCGLAVSWGDEADPDGARAAAFGLLDAVGDALNHRRTLDGAVMQAGLSGWAFRSDQTTSGYRVQITFEVACEAFTNHTY